MMVAVLLVVIIKLVVVQLLVRLLIVLGGCLVVFVQSVLTRSSTVSVLSAVPGPLLRLVDQRHHPKKKVVVRELVVREIRIVILPLIQSMMSGVKSKPVILAPAAVILVAVVTSLQFMFTPRW